jgi:hypothetical protein
MRDERRHMMLASVALICTAATFWSLRLIKAEPPRPEWMPRPDSGSAKKPTEVESLADYIVPVARVSAADTSTAFMLPLSDPFDRGVRPAPTHLNIPPLPDSIVPPPVVIPPAPKWVLSGTGKGPRGWSATVDDSIVTVGSAVRGGGRVTRIDRDYVEITDAQGRVHRVRLP